MHERTWSRSARNLLMGAALVGSAVAALAAYLGAETCGASGLNANDCRGLVRTYAIRIGLFTGVATAVMTLFVRGLRQMADQSEADRRQRRRETVGEAEG